MTMRLALALLTLGAPRVLAAEPCAGNKPGDRGLRILVESVFTANPNTLTIQRMYKVPETPVKGTAATVDELKWCKCVHRKKVERLGEDLAKSMSLSTMDPKVTARYDAWLKDLPPLKAREHVLLLGEIEATCVNESQR